MRCWICDKEGAEFTRDLTITETKHFYGIDIPSRKVVKREHQRCYCKECYDNAMKTLREENALYIRLKHKRMFETALDKMERQKVDFNEYKEAIKTIEEYNLEHDNKFDSSYEIMTAIVLIHNHIHIKPQASIGRYQVDFLLPEEQIVLEIDGDRHKHRKDYDRQRDREIKDILGPEWQIIRIDTDNIDKDVKKIVKAIDLVLDYRSTGKINWRAV